MHSARSEPAPRRSLRARIRFPLTWLGRLNVRLFLILAGVALVALLVSGIAISQILPGYFVDQAEQQAKTVQYAVDEAVQDAFSTHSYEELIDLQTRNQIIQAVVQSAVNRYAQCTVEVTYARDGSTAAFAVPSADTSAALREEGLRPDPDVVVQPRIDPNVQIAFGYEIGLIYEIRDPYTNRVTTLQRVGDTLIGAGLVALLVSLFIGFVGARALTRPLARLRRVSNRFSHGELDERAPRFGILEVDDLAHQFNVMADRLSESVRLLEADRDRLREFVADVSHELRTPIAALRTFSELQEGSDLGDEQRREFQVRSREQIARLEWMSANLLDLSRIDAGIFPMDIRDGDLRDPVRSVAEAHSELAEQRGISLRFEVPTAPVMLRFDRERVVQLLSNLVGNALKFTPRGGEVIVSLRDDDGEGVLEVRDSGPGISSDELPHVFERFFRGTNVGEARASGSGLGLAIARSIADMHGGRILVTSAPGRGATFTVHLPRDAEQGQ
jgi:signal transduction histidine kinase